MQEPTPGTVTNNTARISNLGKVAGSLAGLALTISPFLPAGSREAHFCQALAGVLAAVGIYLGNLGSQTAKESALRRVDQVAVTTAQKVAGVVGTVNAGEIIDAARVVKKVVRR